MCDKLVFDLSQEVEGAPSVFVRKDWINILDNQNQSYVSNQSVLDTSQLSNSNKWMSYREAYFSVPLLISMATPQGPTLTDCTGITVPAAGAGGGIFQPATATKSVDMAVGLKNWYGNIIHSFTLDYNGSTIVQQTPFINMWNSFKLMTSLSYQDILTQGPTIGFYPDVAEAVEYYGTINSVGTAVGTLTNETLAAATTQGIFRQVIPGNGTCNNTNQHLTAQELATEFQSYQAGHGNDGLTARQKYISYSPDAIVGSYSSASKYSQLLSSQDAQYLWKSYIIKKQNQVQVSAADRTQTTAGIIQYAVVATIYLKHIHSFFNMIPLLKGVFMKMTMNLNNVSCTVLSGVATKGTTALDNVSTKFQVCSQVNSALGGSNMLMVAANYGDYAATATSVAPANAQGASSLMGLTQITTTGATDASFVQSYRLNLSVGGVCLDSTITNIAGSPAIASPLSKSIYLYIPAYTFNPTFEQAYLSSPVKTIKYTDVYQYQVLGVSAGQPFNNLLTNGIANVKSVLILPFYSSSGNATPCLAWAGSTNLSVNSGFISGIPVWNSPFDPAGCGPTSPLSHITNFNVQVSGQNAIYNLQKYGFEQFNNQLYGQNAVNGGLTDGITSSLINRQDFDLEYCYYYVNIERMLPVEQSVPKSIQILGTVACQKNLDLLCFIEYGTEVAIDALTGSRV
jgi:hypothetical protein